MTSNRRPHTRSRGRPAHPDILTPAEWRVAEGVRHGLTNPQIAARLGISMDAVKFHVSNVLGKLGLEARGDLRRWAGVAADTALATGNSKREDNGMAQDKGRIGAIGQVARTVSDIGEAREWYGKVLGLEPLFDAGKMAFFACDGTRLMLVEEAEGKSPGNESILYFRVGDLHGEFARLEAAGAKVASAPHRIHTHEDGSEEWMAFIEDNDGRPLGLMATVSPTSR